MPTIKELRQAKGWTQYDLAHKSKVGFQTVRRAEKGIEPVNESTIILICQALGIDPSEVTGVNIVNRVVRDTKKEM